MSQITSAEAIDRNTVRNGAELVWLLSLSYAGAVHRVATSEASVTIAGVSTPFAGNLSVSVTIEADVGETLPAARQAAITIAGGRLEDGVVVGGVADWAWWEAMGHDLSAATAELALWVRGTDWEDRVVVISGRVQEPEWGDETEDLTFSLIAAGDEDASVWPPPDAVISATTWPDAVESAMGRSYPWVWGRPGMYTDVDGVEVARPGSPALVIDTTQGFVLIAGHPVRASTVNLWSTDAQEYVVISGGVYSTTPTLASATDFTVETTTDGLGRIVSYLDCGILLPTDQEFWVVWSAGGGIANELGDDEMDRAGDILRWWLERASQGVDAGRLAAAAGLLTGYRLAGYVDEPVGVWEWVRQELLPILPIAVVAGPSGLYPVVYQLDSSAFELALTEGQDYDRTSRVTTDDTEIATRIRLSWALDASADEYGRTTVLTGNPDATDPEQVSDAYVTIAERRSGVRELLVESPWIFDGRTAGMVLSHLIRAKGYARRSVTIAPEPWVAAALEALARVSVTDEGLHQEGLLHRVRSVTWDNEEASVELLRIEDPVRERRTP